jgi:putative tryptophan/tyrosine transport system substrate-binding protein
MRRRDFIKAVSGISVGWLPPAYAQRTNKAPRVGVLWHAGSAEEEAIGLGALSQALAISAMLTARTLRFIIDIPPKRLSDSRVYLPNLLQFQSTYWLQ